MRSRFLGVLAALAFLGAFLPQPSNVAAQQSRNLTVMVGYGQDTMDAQSFFPQSIRIRAGDNITWKQNSDAPHTVSFYGSFPGPADPNLFSTPGELTVPGAQLPVPGRAGVNMLNPLQVWPYPANAAGSTYRPGEFVSSGRFLAVPPTPGVDEITTFNLTFDRPGSYSYICLTHRGTMVGTVEVAATSATDVPSPAEIDAKAQAEIGALAALVERQKAQMTNVRTEPGPNGNNVWYVAAGGNFYRINDLRANLDEFMPRNLTIAAGDTVIWASNGGHAVTFNPMPPPPPVNLLETLPDGTVAVIQNPDVFDPVMPSGVYDPTQFYNSGNIARNQPSGTAWALTFATPGSFEYYCSVHRERGMTGMVTVLAS